MFTKLAATMSFMYIECGQVAEGGEAVTLVQEWPDAMQAAKQLLNAFYIVLCSIRGMGRERWMGAGREGGASEG